MGRIVETYSCPADTLFLFLCIDNNVLVLHLVKWCVAIVHARAMSGEATGQAYAPRFLFLFPLVVCSRERRGWHRVESSMLYLIKITASLYCDASRGDPLRTLTPPISLAREAEAGKPGGRDVCLGPPPP